MRIDVYIKKSVRAGDYTGKDRDEVYRSMRENIRNAKSDEDVDHAKEQVAYALACKTITTKHAKKLYKILSPRSSSMTKSIYIRKGYYTRETEHSSGTPYMDFIYVESVLLPGEDPQYRDGWVSFVCSYTEVTADDLLASDGYKTADHGLTCKEFVQAGWVYVEEDDVPDVWREFLQ